MFIDIINRKVCIITAVHPPFYTRIFHKEAKTLVEAGYDVTLIAQHDNNKVIEGIIIIVLPKPLNRFHQIAGLTWQLFHLVCKQQTDILLPQSGACKFEFALGL